MKYAYPVTLLCLLLCFSCRPKKTPAKTDAAAVRELPPELHTDLYGNWVGDFISISGEEPDYEDVARINIRLTRITAEGVEGRSVVKGNDRPMKGALTVTGNKYAFVMDEPGSDRHDGRFEFFIMGDTLKGRWKAYKATEVKNPVKEFTLVKKPFRYNANLMLPEDWEYVDYENGRMQTELYTNEDGTVDTSINKVYRAASEEVYKLNGSASELTEKQLKNLKKLDLEIIRNTIFARHGYSFKSKGVRQFFDQVDWYVPVTNNIDGALTGMEQKNVALLQRFEKYAQDNYDSFGR
ncbi:YARHG domain-containing protein [Niabella drilacis]|uniref:YARHG domain-containing protein n=1 Tax=Niabella drilacis (strain DSM 25811 / CCM 8410 / CCUG 62505 / LMG 26954 / E90) TaxID=1285928 RepID=A0A1G6ZQA2_NIADE|nr:YARHG domain-containing protein [Niabella drilacis]SDE04563.1 YARHG domain-containing protein [Niabella drilacis]